MTFSASQKEILQKLLKKYESSRTYKNENLINQNFSISPIEIFSDYNSDFADIDKITDFENQVKILEENNFIEIKRKNERIEKIIAISNDENWMRIRQILNVKEKRAQQQEELDFYHSKLSELYEYEIITNFCKNQIERISVDKKAQFVLDESKNIINLLKFIFENKSEILERELSISVLHDSKLWEQKYKSKVCKILRESGKFSDVVGNIEDGKEIDKAILEEVNIFSNPSYIYFKGNAKIIFENRTEIIVTPDCPIAISSSSIQKVQEFQVLDGQLMTVENLTTFNRVSKPDTFFIYLSGYHNSAKQKFLVKIFNENPDKKYFHFGDIDPDGFLILENLRNKTKINFIPFCMNVEMLKKYSVYTKKLERNDIAKANGLIQRNLYIDVMQYMLQTGRKLEQEIIGWLER